MSAQTPADESLSKAREMVGEAIEQLAGIVVHERPGSNEFNAIYKRTMRQALSDLMDVREALKP